MDFLHNKPDRPQCRIAALRIAALAVLIVILGCDAQAAIVQVQVAAGEMLRFTPASVTIHPGDTVNWTWQADHHSVTAGTPTKSTGLFDSGIKNSGFTFSHTFPTAGTFSYFCQPHGACCGMTGSVLVTNATPTAGILGNISTRLRVETNDNVLIGGFIIGGTGQKQLLIRALGPTLTQFGVAGALQNPFLELRNSAGALITSNDNWGQAANAQSIPINLRPPNSLESVIFTSLNPGAYTAIVRGLNNTTGVALVEAYDMAPAATSHLTNISTRGLVQTGDNVMIAGLIVQSNSEDVIVRALGPTLVNFGVTNPLANPTLELQDAQGVLLAANDNWRSTQQSQIMATGKAPPNDAESAIVRTLTPGNYSAIVRGVNNTTGVALVEVYALP